MSEKEETIRIDQLIRSKRKTISLIIEGDGRLVVRAPLRTPLVQIRSMVQENSNWIHHKQAETKKIFPGTQKRFLPGEQYYYLGQPYPLEIVTGTRIPLRLETGHFYLAQSALPKAKEVFIKWYREQAGILIKKRVDAFSGEIGYNYKRIRITSARTRWGSCSSIGTLSFTWRLLMAPLSAIDYVVVHELAHLEVNNHSPRFWQRVEAVLPDYKQRRDWLKKNGKWIRLEIA